MLQTNGISRREKLDALLERGVTRIDVASIDRFHKHRGSGRRGSRSFKSRGMSGDDPDPLIEKATFLKKTS
jgi:hypothetical protein